jgi:hypothetical protein
MNKKNPTTKTSKKVTAKTSKNTKVNLNSEIPKLMKDDICKQWILYATRQPNKTKTTAWYKEKQDYWNDNHDYLKSKGFDYDLNINYAMDFVKCQKEEDLEGCLLIFKVGSKENPASISDLEDTGELIKKTLSGIKGVKVLITHHAFDVQKVTLPQIKKIQTDVIKSARNDDSSNANPIISLSL